MKAITYAFAAIAFAFCVTVQACPWSDKAEGESTTLIDANSAPVVVRIAQ